MDSKVLCPICVEEVRPAKTIGCPKCSFTVCHSCVVQFAKTSKGDTKCMSCNAVWERVFMFRSLPPSLVFGQLKAIREAWLVERETMMLPATQQILPILRQKAMIAQEAEELSRRIEELELERQQKRNAMYALDRNITNIKREMDGLPPRETTQAQPAPNRPQIICPCPADNCRGFIMIGTNYVCGTCETKICKDCHVVLGEDAHTCDPNIVASVKLIRRECKPCPSCGIPSRKTEGCSQVWCLGCHKAWNWNTSEVETGHIHATDYFTYMRRTGQQIPRYDGYGNQCGHMPITPLIQLLERRFSNNFGAFRAILTPEVEDFLTCRYQVAVEYTNNLNREPATPLMHDLRIKYLQGQIDEVKWKRQMHKLEKEYTIQMETHKMRCAYTVSIREALDAIGQSKTLDDLKIRIDALRAIHDMIHTEFLSLMVCCKSKRKSPFLRPSEQPSVADA